MNQLAEIGRQQQTTLEQAPREPGLFDCRGVPYIRFMQFVMQTLGSRCYFEIGTDLGLSLAGVTCKSVAVDPAFKVEANVIGEKDVCMFFQMPSDRFFRDYSLSQLLGGPFDVAFLDGLHVFEFLLRDFMHTEKHGRTSSIVFLHDCLPFNFAMARRRPLLPGAKSPGIWTGDVWKLVPILRKCRPDLRIHALDCFPTGLIMVTGLDPKSRVLDDNYFGIVEEFAESAEDRERLLELRKSTAVVETARINEQADLARYCW
jgi:hypothetical protein